MKHKAKTQKVVDEEILKKGRDVVNDFDSSAEIQVIPEKQETKLISIRLPVGMISDLREIALWKGGIGYQHVIKAYISEGLFHDRQLQQQTSIMMMSYNAANLSASLSMKSWASEVKMSDEKPALKEMSVYGG